MNSVKTKWVAFLMSICKTLVIALEWVGKSLVPISPQRQLICF